MRAPKYWERNGLCAALLEPLAIVTAAAARRRCAQAQSWRAPVPVVSVGNLVAGGAGKTPVAMAFARYLTSRDAKPHFVTRGYGGTEEGPLRVDPYLHTAAQVGDEPLLLAENAPTWVAHDRAAGAREAIANGAESIVLDDGHQNFDLVKDLSIIVIDGAYGFGNGRPLPAGPLREDLTEGLARADHAVILGEDTSGVEDRLAHRLPLLHGKYVPIAGSDTLAGRDVVAFAGIGRPEKFFRTLEEMSCKVVARRGFPDHHPYQAKEIVKLIKRARKRQATLVTTAKDAVRLPAELRSQVEVLDVVIEWREPNVLVSMLDGIQVGGALAAHG